jgi:hypothetical protein
MPEAFGGNHNPKPGIAWNPRVQFPSDAQNNIITKSEVHHVLEVVREDSEYTFCVFMGLGFNPKY